MNPAILEIFAEASYPPSHLVERRLYRAALRDRDRRDAKLDQERFNYHHEFSFRRSLIDPLPWVCACVLCRKHFGHEQGLLSHLRCRRVACSR